VTNDAYLTIPQRTARRRRGRPPIDLTGQRFGCLTVIAYGVGYPELPYVRWRCRCDCGNERLAISQGLRRGQARSCGKCECGLGEAP
jgi:hypothetical protein